MMKKWFVAIAFASVLAACSNTGSGSSQMYGEIKGGVESSRSF